ncbi:uncharacterized protein TNCT_353201 [Trichonephila clavata]|uniref:Uncharacterized protein n=1 Tax=Trichonephila clavata TaxID=2740835 RepID=A0A8X6LDM9_TRICU|nr:uncharacterized protein TNCT_353201 [Trichonephila clavata]
MIKRFEETGKLSQSGRGRKRVTPVLFDDVKTAVDAQSGIRVASLGAVAHAKFLDRQAILKSSSETPIMHYPYKMRHTQELLDKDKTRRLSFEISFLNKMTVDLSWPWNILWSDETRFYLNGKANMQY